MATQNGIVRLYGKLGDLIFYQRKKKAVVRRVKKDGTPYKLSEGSKQSGKNFGEACKNARYIRKAFALLVKKYGDGELINRLNKRLIDIFKTISATDKKLIDGNISLLTGFEFNGKTALDKLYYASPIVSIEPNGQLSLKLIAGSIDALFCEKVKFREVCLNLMVFNFDLNGDNYEIFRVNELHISLDKGFEGGSIEIQTDQIGEKGLIIALGVHYTQGKYQNLDKRNYACSLTHAFHLRDGMIVPFIAPPIDEKPKDNEDEDTGLNWKIG